LKNEIIYRAGIRIRNPSLQKYFDFLIDSDRWDLERLEKLQLEKTRELLIFANRYSEYYKELFKKVKFKPKDFQGLQDLKKIPISNKKDLLKYNKEIHSRYSFDKVFLSETSGTSGEVLKFYRNEEWDSFNRATMFRGYSWYNVKPWERNGYFWGYNFDRAKMIKTRVLDALQNRFRLFTYDADEVRRFAERLKGATYLTGYSSMIYEVARIVNELGIRNEYDLKMVKGTSEKIFESYQDEVRAAFGRRIISEYGAAESGLIAFECPEGFMHINMENVIIEEENDEIVVTNLNSRSFPIIRYRLGDYIKLADQGFRCPCGRAHPVILEVMGRVGGNIIGNKGIYPTLTLYYLFKNLSLVRGVSLSYQAVQKEKGKIILRIEQNSPEYTDLIKTEIRKYFKEDVDFDLQWGVSLRTKYGKIKDFITYIDQR